MYVLSLTAPSFHLHPDYKKKRKKEEKMNNIHLESEARGQMNTLIQRLTGREADLLSNPEV